ncbi:twin-arginine translocase TatA/TatE family subunit [Candidatus Desulfovibrio trichonymphae]|uniref:Sec-independent protein translocase protein TatB n=1 Tax=Candidatus Desulfovibrio trichonymphae TaxID=1725232 RepID=A0A1J1DXA0_9BACT|nr:twin-arginine translocase TatA/TatE family subunit [Candidatus Desulfovibrio trichonymphae]BAV92500.1 Sec-independent protein translocase protein TatB [Candidatus Desulfovibrio trichonymphae]GHU90182.1 Sec-independent protein translocase protein TatB [Deltaproteobacteria bacterium]
MFGIGSTEFLVILVVALIVLGPQSLAGISRSLGKALGEFRRVSTDFQRTLNAEAAEAEEMQRKKESAAASVAEPLAGSPLAEVLAKADLEANTNRPSAGGDGTA